MRAFVEAPTLSLNANLDYETDSVIQESLRRELDKGVTLLTIAHRLQTIMDADKIVSRQVNITTIATYKGNADGPGCRSHSQLDHAHLVSWGLTPICSFFPG